MVKILGFENIEFDEVLQANDPDFIEKLKVALGVSNGDEIMLVSPQFDRNDGIIPVYSLDVWNKIKSMSAATLKKIGCRPWDEHNEDSKQLWLLPAEWYDKIPEGFNLTDINGEVFAFKHGETDDDRRLGVLAYGVEIDTN